LSPRPIVWPSLPPAPCTYGPGGRSRPLRWFKRSRNEMATWWGMGGGLEKQDKGALGPWGFGVFWVCVQPKPPSAPWGGSQTINKAEDLYKRPEGPNRLVTLWVLMGGGTFLFSLSPRQGANPSGSVGGAFLGEPAPAHLPGDSHRVPRGAPALFVLPFFLLHFPPRSPGRAGIKSGLWALEKPEGPSRP